MERAFLAVIEDLIRGHVRFVPENRLDSRVARFLIEFERAVHIAVVGERHGGHFELFSAFDERVELADTVEKGVVRVRVQMDERNRARRRAFPRRALGFVRSGFRFFFLRGRRLAFFRLFGRSGFFFVFFEFVFFGIFQKTVELFVAHSRLILILSKTAYCGRSPSVGIQPPRNCTPKRGRWQGKPTSFDRLFRAARRRGYLRARRGEGWIFRAVEFCEKSYLSSR